MGGASEPPAEAGESGADGRLVEEGLSEAALSDLADIAERGGAARDDLDQEAEEFDLTAANDRRQSAIAVTFLARLDEAATFEIEIAGGGSFRSKSRSLAGHGLGGRASRVSAG